MKLPFPWKLLLWCFSRSAEKIIDTWFDEEYGRHPICSLRTHAHVEKIGIKSS